MQTLIATTCSDTPPLIIPTVPSTSRILQLPASRPLATSCSIVTAPSYFPTMCIATAPAMTYNQTVNLLQTPLLDEPQFSPSANSVFRISQSNCLVQGHLHYLTSHLHHLWKLTRERSVNLWHQILLWGHQLTSVRLWKIPWKELLKQMKIIVEHYVVWKEAFQLVWLQ